MIAGLLLIVSLTNADVYFHNPRGSNNRLNEASTARSNANRMFDSQVGLKSQDCIFFINFFRGLCMLHYFVSNAIIVIVGFRKASEYI